jgi:hypothetical protein
MPFLDSCGSLNQLLSLVFIDHAHSVGTMKHQKASFRAHGCDLDLLDENELIYWLSEGGYAPFTRNEFDLVKSGKAKL